MRGSISRLSLKKIPAEKVFFLFSLNESNISEKDRMAKNKIRLRLDFHSMHFTHR